MNKKYIPYAVIAGIVLLAIALGIAFKQDQVKTGSAPSHGSPQGTPPASVAGPVGVPGIQNGASLADVTASFLDTPSAFGLTAANIADSLPGCRFDMWIASDYATDGTKNSWVVLKTQGPCGKGTSK